MKKLILISGERLMAVHICGLCLISCVSGCFSTISTVPSVQAQSRRAAHQNEDSNIGNGWIPSKNPFLQGPNPSPSPPPPVTPLTFRQTPNSNSRVKGHTSRLSIDINMGRNNNATQERNVRWIRVKNEGPEDFVSMSVYDKKGHLLPIVPSEFALGQGLTTEIPLRMPLKSHIQPNFARSTPTILGSEGRSAQAQVQIGGESKQEFITVMARGKRDSVERSFIFGDQYGGDNYNQGPGQPPLCVDLDVTGTCRYRSDPECCFRFHWTAYATIYNNYGGQKISSLPEGLFVEPGDHGRVRVYLKVSCCTQFVQFISTDPYLHEAVGSCIVDVRELQTLHPGEIAAISVAAVVLLIIIVVLIVICARRRRRETINKVKMGHVGILPKARSRSRDREVMTSRGSRVTN